MNLGTLGENLAREFLQEQGFLFVEKNYRTRLGEIDLIMQKGEEVFFVEVKTRIEENLISAPEDLPESKLEKIEATASEWLDANHQIEQWSFLLVSIRINRAGKARIKLVQL